MCVYNFVFDQRSRKHKVSIQIFWIEKLLPNILKFSYLVQFHIFRHWYGIGILFIENWLQNFMVFNKFLIFVLVKIQKMRGFSKLEKIFGIVMKGGILKPWFVSSPSSLSTVMGLVAGFIIAFCWCWCRIIINRQIRNG